MDALNASLPQIYDEFEEDRVKKRVLNAADTEAAKDKLMKIEAAFETWVWNDVERADRLARIYNDRFNNLVPRHFDGSHLTIPGASSGGAPHRRRSLRLATGLQGPPRRRLSA
jgi:N12 class adenine-specific DNA methylase